MSAIGTKRTFICALQMSAFGGKADMRSLHREMSAYDPKRTSSTFGQQSCVRMGRKTIVTVAFDAMMPFARLFLRIDMNDNE